MNEKQQLKAKLMTQIIAEASKGQMEQFVGKLSKNPLTEFVSNVEYIVDEIIKRSSK